MPSKGDALRIVQKRYRDRNRAAINSRKRATYAADPRPALERGRRYRRLNETAVYEYNAAWQRKRNASLRAEMLTAYGGACSCCGERQPLFLDLDHVNNDGAEHRREVGNNTQVMLQLKAQGWPKVRVQLLCCNCNQGKARNGGVCPHVKNPF